MSVAMISHPECRAHDMGDDHPEAPARIAAIQDRLIASGLEFVLRQYDALPIDRPLLELAHEKGYIDAVFDAAPSEGYCVFDEDTRMNPGTLRAALLSAGAATQGVDLVMSGAHRSVFCATRPPGHHAERDKAMGFCFFNNVAIAALYAQQKYHLTRIAVLDFDVHHGNGTENILADKSGFLFCSSFQHPLYPYSGSEPQAPHIISTPLSAFDGSETFRQAIELSWFDELERFRPQLILLSAGFDAHREDAIAQLNLQESDYQWITEEAKKIANKYAKGRIVSVLEGGYNLSALGRSVAVHINALMG